MILVASERYVKVQAVESVAVTRPAAHLCVWSLEHSYAFAQE